ncbi:MAG TPA: CUAEP/CCAEP-tail radical SAM protein, partial [Ktedonobacterales bacterium]|nr:CUAEP/CCAEP-tail radical SAM protein [Ktedonobacterales bacterium]
VLTQDGYAPVAVDTSVEPLTDAAISQAKLVCISVPMHTALRLAMRVAEQVRQVNPAARLCFYGLYASLNAEYLFQQGIDYIIGGEYEQALLGLAQTIEAGQTSAIAGVSTPAQRAAPILSRLPFVQPERQALPPLQRYARLQQGSALKLAGYVEASRGCLHTCLHCPITPVYGGRFFVVPREIVLQDIRAQVQMGAEHITFGDPDFLNGPGHSLNILRAMHAEFPHLTFDATIKIEHILERRSLFAEFKALGCAFIVSAVESVSNHVLTYLDKGHTRADIIEALAILGDAGIPMRPSLLPFTPWTTLDDYLDLLHFVEEHGLIEQIDPVHYSIRLLLPPESALLEQPYTRLYLTALDQANFSYGWVHPDPRMDQLQRDVAALAEAAERDGSAPADTFAAILALAEKAAGLTVNTARPTRQLVASKATPHLTESWFC